MKTRLNINKYLILTLLCFICFSCKKNVNTIKITKDYGQGNFDIWVIRSVKKSFNLDNLRGNIKSIEFNVYDAKKEFGEIVKGNKIGLFIKHGLAEFNADGKLIDFKLFANEKIYSQTKFEYDINGNLVTYQRLFAEEDDQFRLDKKIIYKYNEHNHLILATNITNLKNDTIIRNDTYSYKYEDGKLSEVLFELESLRRPLRKRVNTYNELGYLFQYSLFNSENQLTSSNNIKYNENGDITEILRFNEKGLNKSKEIYQYQSKKLIEKSIYHKLELAEKFKYSYKGEKLTELKHSDYTDWKPGFRTFRYNENGDESQVLYYDTDGSFNSAGKNVYKYDKHNNWIEMISFSDDKPIELTERKITYFE